MNEMNEYVRVMSNYEKACQIVRETKAAKPGDQVDAHGIRCTIDEIYYQDFWMSDRNDGTCDWDIEFVDTNSIYRHWKQYFDGGQLIRKED